MAIHISKPASGSILLLFLSSITLPVTQSVSQSHKVDLSGYQDFRWGMSRKSVESILKSKKEEISHKDEDNITVQSTLQLDGFPPSIQVEKSFAFLNNALGEITLTYKKSLLPFNTDSIYARLHRSLVLKYGQSHSDTLVADDDVLLRFSRWDFSKGFVVIRSVQFPETSRAKSFDLPEFIFVHYGRKGFEQELERAKKKRALEQF